MLFIEDLFCLIQDADVLQVEVHCQQIATPVCSSSELIMESVWKNVLKDSNQQTILAFQVSPFL